MECEKNTNWSQNNIQSWRFFYLLFILQNFFQNYFILQWLSDYSKMIVFKSKSRLKAFDIALKENVAKVK